MIGRLRFPSERECARESWRSSRAARDFMVRWRLALFSEEVGSTGRYSGMVGMNVACFLASTTMFVMSGRYDLYGPRELASPRKPKKDESTGNSNRKQKKPNDSLHLALAGCVCEDAERQRKGVFFSSPRISIAPLRAASGAGQFLADAKGINPRHYTRQEWGRF